MSRKDKAMNFQEAIYYLNDVFHNSKDSDIASAFRALSDFCVAATKEEKIDLAKTEELSDAAKILYHIFRMLMEIYY